MWAKADCSRSCGERAWHCSSGMKDLEGGIRAGKAPEVRRLCGRGSRAGRRGGDSALNQRHAPLPGQLPSHLATVAVTPSAVMAVSTCSTASTSSS